MVTCQRRIFAELQALRASLFEVPARGAANLVDAASVSIARRSEVDARPIGPCRESHHAEVSGLHGSGDVVAAHLAPADEVFRGNEDTSVRPGATARAASQAVELDGHGPNHALARPMAHMLPSGDGVLR